MNKRKKTCGVFSLLLIVFMLVSFLSCRKTTLSGDTKINPPGVILDSVMDLDSNYYPYTKIGNKYWMVRDLKVLRFRNGDNIPAVLASEAWRQLTGPACCYFNNAVSPDGLLYNGFVLTDTRPIAPEGWRIANEQDWLELEEYIGITASELRLLGWRGFDEGRKLKTEGRKGWLVDISTWPDNYYRLSLSGNGGRMGNGAWTDPGLFSQGFWWSAPLNMANQEDLYFRHLDYKSNLIFRDRASQRAGYAIRCVKDIE